MSKRNEILKVRKGELAALLRKYSPSFKDGKFKIVHNERLEWIEIYPTKDPSYYIGFDMIEPLQMFCHMYSLLWLIMPSREYGLKIAVHADYLDVKDD